MSENLRTDPSEINKLILNVAIKKVPIFLSYKYLGVIRKNQEIDYVDFEWKYYQYYHGNTDLTIERSPQNSSPVTFSDLPMDVLEKVVEKSDLSACLALRKVSRGLRNLVDTTEIHCEKICFEFEKNCSEIMLQPWETINYCQIDDGCCKVSMEKEWELNSYKLVTNSNFMKKMIDDASTFLKNPKLKIGEISFLVDSKESISEFLDFLKTLDSPLDVRSVQISKCAGTMLQILQFLKPEALEKISVDFTFDQWDEIAETKQWKMAKKLQCRDFPDDFRIEKMLHFKEITNIDFEFDNKNLIKIREILLKSTSLESCYLEYVDDDGGLDDFLGYSASCYAMKRRIIKIMSEIPSYDAETCRLLIPDSRDYFQLELKQTYECVSVSIKRCSRNE